MNYILLFILVVILIIVSFTIYKSEIDLKVKLLSLPILLAFSILLSYHYMLALGAPIKTEPVGEWTYVHHQAYATKIVLWTLEDRGPRLYEFPDSNEIREALEQAQRRSANGETIVGEFNTDTEGGNDESDVLTLVNRPPASTIHKGE